MTGCCTVLHREQPLSIDTDDEAESLLGVVQLARWSNNRSLHPRDAVVQDFVQQLFLASDVVVEPRPGHPGGFGDFVHRRGEESSFVKQ
jgi:hypothetical protein